MGFLGTEKIWRYYVLTVVPFYFLVVFNWRIASIDTQPAFLTSRLNYDLLFVRDSYTDRQ